MKKVLLLLVGLVFFSCKTDAEAPKNYVTISGKIIDQKTDKIEVAGGSDFSREIQLKEDGTFSDTLSIEQGYYFVFHDRYRVKVFLSPGDSLRITADPKNFNKDVKYTGDGASQNAYLSEKLTQSRKLSYRDLYSKEEDDFFKKIDEIKANGLETLSNIKDADATFVALEKKSLEYDYLAHLSYYTRYYPYYTKKKDYKPSARLTEPLANLDYDNEADFGNFQSYRELASDYYASTYYTDSLKEKTIATIKGLKSQNIKDDFAEDLVYEITPGGENNAKLFDLIKELSTKESLIKRVTEKYAKVQTLIKGNDSPKFEYENYAGGETSLADLAGKYVYVDVWATWCGPCLGEIPSLKKVEEDYHDKNIAFVSISIDEKDAYDAWKKMIKEKELGGIQLMADNAWQSKFVTDYAIEGIPRFILIDPNGKIVNADAPRPSNPKLIELFNELKI
jgi:thiol-disulfide isomerase/thioredoxin